MLKTAEYISISQKYIIKIAVQTDQNMRRYHYFSLTYLYIFLYQIYENAVHHMYNVTPN